MMKQEEQYITTKVNPILAPLVTELVNAKPEDPVIFMIDWMERKYQEKKSQMIPNIKTEEIKEWSEDSNSEDESPLDVFC